MNYPNLCKTDTYMVSSDAGKGASAMFTVTPVVEMHADGSWDAENGVALHFTRETAEGLRDLLNDAIASADGVAA